MGTTTERFMVKAWCGDAESRKGSARWFDVESQTPAGAEGAAREAAAAAGVPVVYNCEVFDALPPARDWVLSQIADRGPGHYYRYHVRGENRAAPYGADRTLSWSVRDLADPRYDVSRAEWLDIDYLSGVEFPREPRRTALLVRPVERGREVFVVGTRLVEATPAELDAPGRPVLGESARAAIASGRAFAGWLSGGIAMLSDTEVQIESRQPARYVVAARELNFAGDKFPRGTRARVATAEEVQAEFGDGPHLCDAVARGESIAVWLRARLRIAQPEEFEAEA